MGDVAMLAHALRALKEAYPDLRVTVATRPVFRAFFTGLDLGFMDVDIKGVHHSLRGMWRLAADARRLGVDAVADVHGVLRSVMFRTALWLRGVPVAAIEKGREEKKEFIRKGGRDVKPAKHTVVRYCDVFRKLGFVFDDPVPALRRCRPNPMGEKTGTWIGFSPFSAQQGKTYPTALGREAVRLLAERYDRVFIHSGGGAEADEALVGILGQDGLLALEAVEQDQRIGGDVNGDGARGLARADGQAAVGGMAGGGKYAVSIDGADAALGGPGEAGVLREQGEVVLIGLRGQLDARAGGDA